MFRRGGQKGEIMDVNVIKTLISQYRSGMITAEEFVSLLEKEVYAII